mgnify:CR=1 FL=1
MASVWADRDARGLTSTLEPWVDGLPMSLSLVVGASGTTLVSVNQLHMHVAPDGHVSMAGLTRNVIGEGDPARARLARLARQVVAAIPGLKGFVGIDYVDHPVFGPVVIEVNPRVTWAFAGLSEATGLSLGANLRWQSAIDREAFAYDDLGTATPLRIEQPSYALLGLMANYAINERWSATLNLDNVTDEKYLGSLYWEQGYYGAPRGVTLSVGYRF